MAQRSLYWMIVTLFLLTAIFLLEVSRRTVFQIDAFRLAIFWISFSYLLIPELVSFSTKPNTFPYSTSLTLKIVTIFSILFIAAGFYFSRTLPVKIPKIIKSFQFSLQAWLNLMLITLGLSIFSVLLYVNSFGGVLDALRFGGLNRYTGIIHREVGHGAVALHFVYLAFIPLVVSTWELLVGTKYKLRWQLILLISLLTIFLYALVNASRGLIVTPFLIAIYLYLNSYHVSFFSTKKSTITLYLLGSLLVITGFYFVLHGKSLISNISSFSRGESEKVDISQKYRLSDFTDRFIKEYSHPSSSLAEVINSDIDPNLGKHFFYAPIHLLPTRLLGIKGDKPFRITETNTLLLKGTPTGGVPPGLIASFWYAGDIYGVAAGMFFFGFLIGIIQRISYKILNHNNYFTPIILYIFYSLSAFVLNGDPSIFLKDNIFMAVFFFLLTFFTFLRRLSLAR